MKLRSIFSLRHQSNLLAITLLVSLTISGAIQFPGTQAQTRNQTVIFAVGGEPDGYHMDAVALFNGRQFVAPFSEEQKNAQKTFADKYFANGRKYRLIFGGGEAGSVTVTKWSEGCNSIHSEITTATSARIGGQVRALATNSDSLGQRALSRRPPTDTERMAVMALVKTIYSQRRTPASLMSSLKVTNMTATDLDGDGKHEMIGSFTLTSRNKFQRDLFLIAKSAGTAMRADFVKFQAYQPPPEGFLSSVDFIDQLDVDRNGVGEVFAIQGGFDGYAYLVFRKIGGRWREVYQGVGDVC
ncbi:MAG TPA: hypothetical protein VJT71_13355 [Pyrinomonadaceae bacterium]|nr:hypothetical protein [Pyrinomonadaceae bacterium]